MVVEYSSIILKGPPQLSYRTTLVTSQQKVEDYEKFVRHYFAHVRSCRTTQVSTEVVTYLVDVIMKKIMKDTVNNVAKELDEVVESLFNEEVN